MSIRARWFSRFACVFVVLACADAIDPIAPSAASSTDGLQLSTAAEASPTEEDFESMPQEFRTVPSILSTATDVGFLPAERRAYARGYMTYFSSNASQNVNLSLRLDNSVIATNDAFGEASDWFPARRALVTTAYLGVSGPCGHLAEGTTTHRAWHQFLVGGWKFLSWGNHARTSYGSAEQEACESPPPPPSSPGGGNSDEYEGGCELCEQWFYFIDGRLVDEWWECTSIPDYYCEGLMT